MQFFVKHEFDGIPHLVDVKQQKCTCRVWELLKFPYAVATLHCNGSNVFDYCECYAVTKYQEAYSRIILSIDLQERTNEIPRTDKNNKKRTRKLPIIER